MNKNQQLKTSYFRRRFW